jgi:Tfp pilus assembly protein PilV
MALAIVSIALVALLRLHLVSIRMADTSRVRSQALLLAREKIEEQLATGFPQPSTNTGTEHINSLELKWSTEVTEAELPTINGIRINDLRRISVNVRWNQGPGQKEVKLSTLVANRKL